MRARQELEEDGGIDGEVAPHADRPECREASDCCKIGRTGGDEAKHSSNADGQVESQPSPEDVTLYLRSIDGSMYSQRWSYPKSPKQGAEQKPNVLSQGEQWLLRLVKLLRNGRKDQRGDDGPHVIARPSKSHEDELARETDQPRSFTEAGPLSDLPAPTDTCPCQCPGWRC